MPLSESWMQRAREKFEIIAHAYGGGPWQWPLKLDKNASGSYIHRETALAWHFYSAACAELMPPEGWKLMPPEATKTMIDACHTAIMRVEAAANYRAMYAAAPSTPERQKRKEGE